MAWLPCLNFYTGDDIDQHVDELIRREYGEGGRYTRPQNQKYRVERNLDMTALQQTMIEESWTIDIDQGSDIEVQEWAGTTAKPVMEDAAQGLQLGNLLDGGRFERSPSGPRAVP